MSPVETFDASDRWRPSLAARYGFLPDAAAEVAAACWELIRSGEADQGHLYWRTRRKVAGLAARHGASPVAVVDPQWLTMHAGELDVFDAIVDRVAAAQVAARLPVPPVEVTRLIAGHRLGCAERARSRRWLARYRTLLEATVR